MPRNRKHYRVRYSEAVLVHEVVLRAGGLPGISRPDDIKSALDRPYAGFGNKLFFRFIHQKAAALCHGLASTHGFVDGNKRTAFIMTLILLDLSGYALAPLPGEDLDQLVEDLLVRAANGDASVEDFMAFFKPRIVRQP